MSAIGVPDEMTQVEFPLSLTHFAHQGRRKHLVQEQRDLLHRALWPRALRID
jgi:hypothetical protein